MVAVSGHVNRPGVYEIEQGVTTFRDLFYGDNFCRGIRDGHELKMFVPGGEAQVRCEHADARVSGKQLVELRIVSNSATQLGG